MRLSIKHTHIAKACSLPGRKVKRTAIVVYSIYCTVYIYNDTRKPKSFLATYVAAMA